MTDNVERVNDGIKKEILDDINKITQTTIKQILEAGSTYEHGQCREELFVNVFLPYFAGEIEEKDFPDGITLSTWDKIAGVPTNPVDVINSRGEVLFTVPPLITPAYLHTSPADHDHSFGDAAKKISEYKNVRPAHAEQMLTDEIRKRAPARLTEVKGEFLHQWADIFMRYGYFTDDHAPGGETNNPTSDNLNDLIIGYD